MFAATAEYMDWQQKGVSFEIGANREPVFEDETSCDSKCDEKDIESASND
jgi:hypothetical protein